MKINQVFELSMVLDTDHFREVLAIVCRKSDQLREVEDGYIDLLMAPNGIAVRYRDSQYRKKVRLVVNSCLLIDDYSDADKLARKLDKRIKEYFKHKYLAGADLGGTKIENHARCIERSNQMLTLLNNAVELLRTRHKSGETYYWLLYFTYLSPQQLQNVDEIVEQLQPHLRDISIPTYYRKRKMAVEALSSILWGYTSQECLNVLEEFFPPDEEEK